MWRILHLLKCLTVKLLGPACLLAWMGACGGLWLARLPVPRATTLAGISQLGTPVALSPDGRLLVTTDGAALASLTLWDTATGEQRGMIKVPRAGEGIDLRNCDCESVVRNPIIFSADSKRIAAKIGRTNSDGTVDAFVVGTWNTSSFKELARLSLGGQIEAFDCSPDGKTLVAISDLGQKAKLLSIDTGLVSDIGSASFRSSLHFSADGTCLAEVSTFKGPICLVNTATRKHGIAFRPALAPTICTTNSAFSPDGRTFAWIGLTMSAEHIVELWDTYSGEVRQQFYTRYQIPQGMSISRDSTLLAMSGYMDDSETAQLAKLVGDEWAGRLHPPKNGTTILEMSSGRPIATLPFASYIAFAPDGKTLVMYADDLDAVLFWDLPLHTRLNPVQGLLILALPCILTALWWRARRRRVRAGSALVGTSGSGLDAMRRVD